MPDVPGLPDVRWYTVPSVSTTSKVVIALSVDKPCTTNGSDPDTAILPDTNNAGSCDPEMYKLLSEASLPDTTTFFQLGIF